MLGMVLKQQKWHCRYVEEYLAVGEAPEQVRNCFQQRSRWCKVSLLLLSWPDEWRSVLAVSKSALLGLRLMLGYCIALAQLTVAWCQVLTPHCTFTVHGAAAKCMLCVFVLNKHLHKCSSSL